MKKIVNYRSWRHRWKACEKNEKMGEQHVHG